MKITAEPRSDQWNADDFVGGPRTFTIAGVRTGTAEQKYDIDLVEGEGRSWRPPLTMLRLLITAWGDDGSAWVGRRVTLYRDPSIRFGKDQVGGIRISHLSHIDKPVSVPLTVTRGKKAIFKAEPLVEPVAPTPPPAPTEAEVVNTDDQDQLRAWWGEHTALRPVIEARVAQLKADAEAGEQS
jgi:hypothetical protein